MTAQSGLGFSGIVAIQIPDDGALGTVLTKLSADNYDYEWAAGGGGGGGDVLALTIPGGVFTLTQSSGVSPLTVDLVGGVSGAFLYKPGIAGGQSAFGGTAAGDSLTLQGSVINTGAVAINLNSPVVFGPYSGTSAVYGFDYSATETFSAPFIGGGLNFSGTIAANSGTFIYESFRGAPLITTGATPGFAAYTVLQSLPLLRGGTLTAEVPYNPLIVNAGAVLENPNVAVAQTTGLSVGMNFAPQTRATGAFGTMSVTAQTAVQCQPTFSSVNTSVINLGTITGIQCNAPAVALFQPATGTENLTAYYGINYADMIGFIGADNVVVRSSLSNNAAHRLLDNIGGADSDFRAGDIHFNDLAGPRYGNTIAAPDWQEGWAAAGFKFEQQITGGGGQLRKSFPAAGRMLFDWTANTEFNINCVDGCSIGDQVGALGNSFFNIVQGAVTPGAAGDFAGVLLTQSGSYTNNGLARGRVSAWVVNGLSYAASTGSVAEADTLTVGGMATSAPGVTLTTRQALNVIGGRSRFSSTMMYPPITPATLAAGATQDYAGLLTGTANNGMRHWARLAGDGAGTSALGGIDATFAQDGDTFKLTNVSANNVTLNNQDAGSVAANRIISPTGANYVLGPDESAEIIYDVTTARWRILYGTGA